MDLLKRAKEFRKRFVSPLALVSRGIMGMNQRNINYIGRYNQRSRFPAVDDKLLTERLAEAWGVKTPVLIATIHNQQDIQHLPELIGSLNGFCIKPAKGSGGKGILIIREYNQAAGIFVKSSGQELDVHALKRHLSNILAGLFSLGGRPDIALIEELIHADRAFADYSYEGVPDIRVIVFQGFPVMCMLRLSTSASDGRANLHQGAVGVGLCLRTGRAVRAVQYNLPLKFHPDTGKLLSRIRVPYWNEVLELASSCYEMTGLGYIGTDVVLDQDKGPMVMELNARPGLTIQICNNAGLLPRLRLVTALTRHCRLGVKDRVAFAQSYFGVFRDDQPEPAGDDRSGNPGTDT